MFKGTYRHSIDLKGRLPVPAAFRRALKDEGRVVVTLLDECLAVYPPWEWARLEDQLRGLPAFSGRVKALTRLLMSRAADCGLDVQGRILIPAALRAGAGLAREAVVVGVLNRFEIWPPEAWGSFLRDSERLLHDVSLDVQWPLPPSEGPRPEGMAGGPPAPQRKPSR